MVFSPRFRQGAKAAIPIWIAFVPSSLAWGIAAQAHGLKLDEVILMVRLGLLRTGAVCCFRTVSGREVCFAGACCRDLDESAVFAHEHCAGALL